MLWVCLEVFLGLWGLLLGISFGGGGLSSSWVSVSGSSHSCLRLEFFMVLLCSLVPLRTLALLLTILGFGPSSRAGWGGSRWLAALLDVLIRAAPWV